MELGVGQLVVEASPNDHALDQLTGALDQLLKAVRDGGLDHYDDAQLMGFLQRFEGFRNRLALVDHCTIATSDARGLPAACAQPSMRQVLVHLLRLSPGEAARRAAAAAVCGDQVSMLGEVLTPAAASLSRHPRFSCPPGMDPTEAGGNRDQSRRCHTRDRPSTTSEAVLW